MSSEDLLTGEQLQCSICLDVFSEPVSTPCGHTFCMGCIRGFWEHKEVCECPLCKTAFLGRPELSLNRTLAEITAHLQEKWKEGSSERSPAAKGELRCDVCTGRKHKAVKSCPECLACYCETHVTPHYQAKAYRRHRLVSLEERAEGRKRGRPLELFGRPEGCSFSLQCSNRASAERAQDMKMDLLGKTKTEVQRMIQQRLLTLDEIRAAVGHIQSSASREINHSSRVFDALRCSIDTSQAEFAQRIEVKKKAAVIQAQGLILRLEQEIDQLRRRHRGLEALPQTDNHVHFPGSLSTIPDCSCLTVETDPFLGTLRKSVAEFARDIQRELLKIEAADLDKMQRYAVDVTLDANTAQPSLVLSENRKQVWVGNKHRALPNNQQRFDTASCVLGKEGFTSGRHYWEVDVGNKTGWDLGVVSKSINRKGRIKLRPENGFWAMWLRKGTEYKALNDPSSTIPVGEKPRMVGVFVGYEEGEVTFYNVEARTHIYTFTDAFSETIYPYFSPHHNQDGRNAAPLTICSIIDQHNPAYSF
ncbi:E3 ubiquitin-protein ligase TRIM21 [Amia ocellicauda]|uniref:E3 ubiquitin-protein ligase TRIM21 n=1 Tax=Amia ocellicauda TaxID=2972642 RepID=UPI0034644426